jgi:hypothetical protein
MGVKFGRSYLRSYINLSVFDNRELRKVFGPKRYLVTGEWRRLHNEELYDVYSSPNNIRVIQIKKNEMGGTGGTEGREERCVRGFGGET